MCTVLEHWFWKVGRYAPIDIDINISIGKETRAAAMKKLKHLKASAKVKKAVDDGESKKKEEKSLSSITAEPNVK
jgi:hypothetical protein